MVEVSTSCRSEYTALAVEDKTLILVSKGNDAEAFRVVAGPENPVVPSKAPVTVSGVSKTTAQVESRLSAFDACARVVKFKWAREVYGSREEL